MSNPTTTLKNLVDNCKQIIIKHEIIGLEGVDLKSIVFYYLLHRGIALEWAYHEVFILRAEEIEAWNTK